MMLITVTLLISDVTGSQVFDGNSNYPMVAQ